MKLIIDGVSALTDINMISKIVMPLFMLFILYHVVNNLLWRALTFTLYITQLKIKSAIINNVCRHIYGHSFQYFKDNLSGKISNNIKTIVDCVEKTIYNYSRIITSMVLLISSLLYMYFVHVVFFYGLLFWCISFFIINVLFYEKTNKLSERYSETMSKIFGEISDCIFNAYNIIVFCKKEYEMKRLEFSLSGMKANFREKEIFFFKVSFFRGVYISLLAFIMLYLLFYLKSQNLVTIGDFVMILSISSQITEHSWNCSEIFHQINDDIGMCNQSCSSIFTSTKIVDKQHVDTFQIQRGKIEFKNVTFSYKNCDHLFQDLSILIKPQEKIGLVGTSGSGKTTFVNLILRLYDIDSGCICIDDQNISSVAQNNLREKISVISQDVSLFHRTIADNIRYSCAIADDQAVIEVSKKATAHDFIQSLPLGYETAIGENGVDLSGGQKQRIAIARALLKNAPILIMDEATSQLDSITEERLQEALNDLMKNKTVIVGAHRMSTISKMDRILVFNNGTIERCGSHDYLLNNSKTYAQLWEKLRC
jgi:ATP-binding cassette subfamily B protein